MFRLAFLALATLAAAQGPKLALFFTGKDYAGEFASAEVDGNCTNPTDLVPTWNGTVGSAYLSGDVKCNVWDATGCSGNAVSIDNSTSDLTEDYPLAQYVASVSCE
ncbi:hypothetical protein ASPZODRAFT_142767 [Penicilliopsis zonata CBS 506.65]|uniref:Uncharacterized protein n=1 Tax=Penicilliopsis zonata CBS 506.65 TaxID=1073090 RepID=A0A1L9SG47_9EURO|nr:hypothetical protein ASPZODRAFT_142767 [Penicilliopsis zonata CBS 506.65]OJJ46141.1 hypothetical protein ASPZODRAFT_142767 [Penicilliopsis zonata CBS 506.65]